MDSMKQDMSVVSNPVLQYILATSALPNEHDQLKELRRATVEKYAHMSIMNVPADEAQLLSIILKLMNAKKTLEIGVFTGYSLLSTALALSDDAKVIAIDPDREAYDVGLPFITKAGVEHKIEFVEGKGMPVLDKLFSQGEEETFDFAFVDGDKRSYIDYHEKLLKLVKVGGLIAYDNTLWFGSVAIPDDVQAFPDDDINKSLKESIRVHTKMVNSFLAKDPRVESILLSIGDGVTLCRRKY